MEKLNQICMWILVAVLLWMAAGCSTIEGFGQDLQDGARITRQYMADK